MRTTPLCLSCKRPLIEEEIELNGLKCNGCDHYDRTLALEPQDHADFGHAMGLDNGD